jgi:16S rRNA (guanine527-N7)-methyltransferase
VSRAVTNMPDFVSWVKTKIKRTTNTNWKRNLYLVRWSNRIKRFQKLLNTFSWFFEDEFLRLKKWCTAVEVYGLSKVESHKV